MEKTDKMEWTTIFEIVLSNVMSKEKPMKKVAKILHGYGKTKRFGIEQFYSINRLEIRVELPNTTPIGVVLTNSELQWLMTAMKNKNEKSAHAGRKMLIYNSIGDTSVSISSIDSDRIFGVCLDENEVKVLLDNERELEFLLKYQNCKSPTLDDITRELYASILAIAIGKRISSKCQACKTGEGEHDLCKKYFKDFSEKYHWMQSEMASDECEAEFLERFHRLMGFLNVASSDRVWQTQVAYLRIKEDKQTLMRKVCNYLDLKEGMGYLIATLLDGAEKLQSANEE